LNKSPKHHNFCSIQNPKQQHPFLLSFHQTTTRKKKKKKKKKIKKNKTNKAKTQALEKKKTYFFVGSAYI